MYVNEFMKRQKSKIKSEASLSLIY